MTDLVERLRDWRDYEPMKMFCPKALPDLREAAAEIERLRRLLGAKVTPGYELLAGELEKRDAEIERLRVLTDREERFTESDLDMAEPDAGSWEEIKAKLGLTGRETDPT